MKTKEEILKECGFVVTVHEEEIGLVTTAFIEPFMKAMEKYADEVSLGKTLQIHARDQQIEKCIKLLSELEAILWTKEYKEIRDKIANLKKELGI